MWLIILIVVIAVVVVGIVALQRDAQVQERKVKAAAAERAEADRRDALANDFEKKLRRSLRRDWLPRPFPSSASTFESQSNVIGPKVVLKSNTLFITQRSRVATRARGNPGSRVAADGCSTADRAEACAAAHVMWRAARHRPTRVGASE